jgi:ABC-type Fe3+/spermidine/putrescine transport system ATPase subunit
MLNSLSTPDPAEVSKCRAAETGDAKPAEIAMRLRGLWKTYAGNMNPAVQDLSLDLRDCEIVTLLGPSGCGKTTTLRMAAGLEVPDAGDIFSGETTVVISSRGLFLPPNKRNVGMVFQSYAIWPHMTVAENVAFPLKARMIPRKEIKDRIRRALELVGMGGFENRPGPLLAGAPDCSVFGRTYIRRGIMTGKSVYIGVRPEDVEIHPANGARAPSGIVGGTAQTALFVGERIEYQVEVDDQGTIVIYGERHSPIDECSKVWLKLRPDGHSASSSGWLNNDGG